MHNPERDPFYEGLWADIQEGIEAAERGDLFDGEDVFRELLDEEPAIAENWLARYRLTGAARRDVAGIRRFIAQDSPGRADAVIKRIRDRCRLIEVAPAQGRVRDDGPPIAGEVRSVPVPPYIVFYRIAAGNIVQVLRVVDGPRDLGAAFFAE